VTMSPSLPLIQSTNCPETTPFSFPIIPLLFPLLPLPRPIVNPQRFHAGKVPVPRRIWAFAVKSVSQSLRFLAPSPSLSSTHLLTLFLGSNL
jgi:hypothetical protein